MLHVRVDCVNARENKEAMPSKAMVKAAYSEPFVTDSPGRRTDLETKSYRELLPFSEITLKYFPLASRRQMLALAYYRVIDRAIH